MATTVVLVGCGNMGSAMLTGWLAQDPTLIVHVVEPLDMLRDRAADLGATVVANPQDLDGAVSPDLVMLAVKPQMMGAVVPSYAHWAGGPATFVSIAAGTTVDTLAGMLPGPTPIIRCMPNTPAAIGDGMMVCFANAHVGQAARALTQRLLATSGVVDWIDSEALMDAVTAVSGSGPAYVFHLIECLAAAGVEVGLADDLARRMAVQTVMGAGKLAASTDVPPGTLREQVTSPGGTTAAALAVMMGDSRMQVLMHEAVRAARDRGAELSKG